MRNATYHIKSHYFSKVKHICFSLLLVVATLKGITQSTWFDSVVMITDKATPSQIIKRINLTTMHFVKVPGNRINFGIVGNKYNYIVLKLNSLFAYEGQYLCIDNTSIDTVNINRIYPDGTSSLLYQGGDLVAFDNKRNYVWHVVPVEISRNPSFYLIALKAPEKNINVKYEVLDKDDLQKKYQTHDRIIFFYIGIVCLITAIIVLAFYLFKKAVFAAYLGYIVCISTWIVSHYGYIFPYVYPHTPVINEIVKPISSIGASFFLIFVLKLVFAQYIKSSPWLQQWMKWMLYILPVITGFMSLMLFPDLQAMIKGSLIAVWHAALILSICIIVFIPFRFIRSSSVAKIFSAAMLVICITSTVQLFANSGYINNSFIDEHGMTMGILLENSIMAFGLIYGLLEEKKQKEIQVLELEQEQTVILKKLIGVQDNERKRIAGDLHDNIGPLLAALKINFRRIIHTKESDLQNGLVSKTESIIDESIAEIRNVAHNLMPKGLSSNGLINTLTEYFGSIEQLYNQTIIFHHQIQSILNSDIQINIYRIICELVLNAARHSNAQLITVGINADEKRVLVTVNDHGQGFQAKPGNPKKTLGLQSAESRVLYMKGKFSLRTEPGKGTVIDMEIPLQFYEPHMNGF